MKKTWLALIVVLIFCGIIVIDSCKKEDDNDKNTPATPVSYAPIHVYSTYFYATFGKSSELPRIIANDFFHRLTLRLGFAVSRITYGH